MALPIIFDGRTGDQIEADINTELGAALQLTESGLTLAGNSLTPSQAALLRAGMGATNGLGPRGVMYPAIGTDVPTLATSGPGGATPVSGSVLMPYNTTNVRLLGSVPVLTTQLGTDYFANNAAGVIGSGATAFAVEAEGYFDDIALVFRNSVHNQSSFWVWVADPETGEFRPTTALPVVSSAAASNSKFYERITFGTLAQRHIRVYCFYADFGGVFVKPTQMLSITAPSSRKMCVITDSYGAGAVDVVQPNTWPFLLARLLGAELFLNAVGGTGYVTVNAGAGGNNNFAAAPRIASAIASGADDFLIAGSINDSSATPAQVTAAADALVSQIKTALPGSRIWLSGVQGLPVGADANGNNAANNAALSAFAAASNIPFIDTLTTWYTGTGKVGATAGNGVRDTLLNTDGIHPSQAGANYIAARKYQSLLSLGW